RTRIWSTPSMNRCRRSQLPTESWEALVGGGCKSSSYSWDQHSIQVLLISAVVSWRVVWRIFDVGNGNGRTNPVSFPPYLPTPTSSLVSSAGVYSLTRCRRSAFGANRKTFALFETYVLDPNVWSGRASQEGSSIWRMRSCINVSGL